MELIRRVGLTLKWGGGHGEGWGDIIAYQAYRGFNTALWSLVCLVPAGLPPPLNSNNMVWWLVSHGGQDDQNNHWFDIHTARKQIPNRAVGEKIICF